MTIHCLVDTFVELGYMSEFGLSLFIEASGRRILFDTGAGKALIPNAARIGIDLNSATDIILSHGHYDHFYDGEQLWVSFWDIDEQFKPCLNDGTPFRLWHYMIYGWFHPDTSVKEYIKLPEETRTFTPEEVQEALQVIDDLKHQYYHNTSSIEERKEIRRKIAEKLKLEYPIR